MTKITEKLQKMYFRRYIFCNFSVIFPHFRGLDRGGEFCHFFPFFGDFRPGGFRSSVRGKTTRKSNSKIRTGAHRKMLLVNLRCGRGKDRVPPEVLPRSPGLLPHTSLDRPSRSIAKRARGAGGRGRERAGREGLWLEGRVLQLQLGDGGESLQRAAGWGQTHI